VSTKAGIVNAAAFSDTLSRRASSKSDKNNNSMRRLPFLSLLLCASLTAHAGGHRTGDPRPATPRAKAAKTDLPPTQISTEGKLLRLD
jgi:hypothetical protein